MSDTQGTATEGGQQHQAPVIINGQYIKDLSFESPNTPGIFQELQKAQPDINLNIDINHTTVDNPQDTNTHEVVIELHATMKVGEKVGFICELKYAGVFTLNVPDEHQEAFLMIECPRILFPFARQILSDATQQGGFVPVFLQPIDFAALYQQNVQGQLDKLDKDVADTLKDKGENEGEA